MPLAEGMLVDERLREFLCRYDEFCLAELKRKYRWKAYARRDEEVITSFLKLAFYRISGQSFQT